MKGMKCTQVRLVNTVSEGEKLFPVHTAVSHWCKFFLLICVLSTASVVVLCCCCCCCIALLWWTGHGGRWVGMSGAIGGGHDGGWWWRGCHGDEGRACYVSSVLHSGGGDLAEGWEDGRRGVLPVAVGHGILSLLLLEELCDGQQLFQHMLQRGNRSQISLLRHELSRVGTGVISSLTCWAPLSLLSVRSSSECVAQTSCSAARSRDRSVLKCSVASGRSGTFYKRRGQF